MAGLSIKFTAATRCTAGLFCLLLALGFNAGAQTRQFELGIAGGYSKIYNNDDQFPFSEAGDGFFVQLSGSRSLGKNWGAIVNIQHNYLPLQTGKAAALFLNNDPNAVAIKVESGRFTMTNIGAGVYYDQRICQNFSVRLVPLIGYSYLLTPKIDVSVDTEPLTAYTYKKGGSPAFFYALSIRPAWQVCKSASIYLDIAYSRANYTIEGQLDDAKANYKVGYGKLNAGIGFAYNFSFGK